MSITVVERRVPKRVLKQQADTVIHGIDVARTVQQLNEYLKMWGKSLPPVRVEKFVKIASDTPSYEVERVRKQMDALNIPEVVVSDGREWRVRDMMLFTLLSQDSDAWSEKLGKKVLVKDYVDLVLPRFATSMLAATKYQELVFNILTEILNELEKLPQYSRWCFIMEKASLSETSKVGEIPCWSLPAFMTCPGYTEFCKIFCYASRGAYRYSQNIKKRIYTFLWVFHDNFEDWFVDEVRKHYIETKNDTGKDVKIVRLHDSGNLFTISWFITWLKKVGGEGRAKEVIEKFKNVLGIDLEKLAVEDDGIYLRKLSNIIRRLGEEGFRFYAYTRVWQDRDTFKYVEQYLLPLKNFVLYLSVDKVHEDSQAVLRDAFDIASKYSNVKLAFTGFYPEKFIKEYRRTATICPQQKLELTGTEETSCDTCGICPYGRADVVFLIH